MRYLQLISIITVFGSIILRFIELGNLKAKWKIKNANNNTYPVKYFPIDLVKIDNYTYGPIDIYTYYAEGEGLIIGKYCSIAKDVKFVLGGNHRTDCAMTYPVRNIFGDVKENESITQGEIVIEDDVWIGIGAIILSGVHLGQGCVVAAASVVTKSFPQYSIIGGNPAKILKMRFDQTILENLTESNLNFGSISPNTIKNNLELFSSKLDQKTLQGLFSNLKL